MTKYKIICLPSSFIYLLNMRKNSFIPFIRCLKNERNPQYRDAVKYAKPKQMIFLITKKFVFCYMTNTRRVYRGTTQSIVSRAVLVEMQKIANLSPSSIGLNESRYSDIANSSQKAIGNLSRSVGTRH